MNYDPENPPQYFAESPNRKYGVISVKCWNGRHFFIKDKSTSRIFGKCESLPEIEKKVGELR